MKKIKYKECYVVGDCLHIQFVDGESYNFLLDSVVEEMVGGLTPLALDAAHALCQCENLTLIDNPKICPVCELPRR